MRTSVVTFDSRQRERLANLADQARIHARDGCEAVTVARVLGAVKLGQVSVRDAYAALSALRRDQQQTAA